MNSKNKFSRVLAGHPDKIELIRTVVSGRNNSHSFLFHGPARNGKSTCADLLAMSLNCLEPEDGLACGNCANCSQYLRGAFPYAVRLKYKFGEIPIDDIRNRIIEPCSFMVPSGIRQVFIIDDVRFFNQSSANCFLKTLEEPIPGVLFILVTAAFDFLLPTLKSRCQCVRFREVTARESEKFILADRPDLSPETVSFLVGASGSVGASISAARSPGFREDCASLLGILNRFAQSPDFSLMTGLVSLAYSGPEPSELVPAEKNLHLDELFDNIESKISSDQYLKNCLATALLIFAKRSSRRNAQAAFYAVSSEIEARFDEYDKVAEGYVLSFEDSVSKKQIADISEHAGREISRLRREEYMRFVASLLTGLEKFFIRKNSAPAGEGADQYDSMLSAGAGLYSADELIRLENDFRAGYYRDISANVNTEFYLENFMLRIIAPKARAS